jgi:hypothetical protein
MGQTRFNGFSLQAKAVKTAPLLTSPVITGLKPGANEKIPPAILNEMRPHHPLRLVHYNFPGCFQLWFGRQGDYSRRTISIP